MTRIRALLLVVAIATATSPATLLAQTASDLVEQGIRDDYIVLVGGAPLNEEFGQAVGADAYCRDAATAVEVAKKLVLEQRAAR